MTLEAIELLPAGPARPGLRRRMIVPAIQSYRMPVRIWVRRFTTTWAASRQPTRDDSSDDALVLSPRSQHLSALTCSCSATPRRDHDQPKPLPDQVAPVTEEVGVIRLVYSCNDRSRLSYFSSGAHHMTLRILPVGWGSQM